MNKIQSIIEPLDFSIDHSVKRVTLRQHRRSQGKLRYIDVTLRSDDDGAAKYRLSSEKKIARIPEGHISHGMKVI